MPTETPTAVPYQDPAAAKQGLTDAFNPDTPEETQSIDNVANLVPDRALLVTSNAARNATAENVSQLQGITSNLQTTNAAADAAAAETDTKSKDTSGGTTGTGTAGTEPKLTANEQAVANIKDPGLKAQYKNSLDSLDKQASQALASVKAAKATLTNDPAAAAAVAQIEALYGQKIQQMKDRNVQIMGKNNTSIAAFGGLGPMGQNFLSDQEERAQQRVTDLITQMQSLVLKAKAAYKENNTKALNAAMKEYDKANNDKLKAIDDLLSETHKQVTEQQAQTRLDQATAKAQLASDVSMSTNIATSLLDRISSAGVTDADQIDEYINSVAEEYGIDNPEILRSAYLKAKTTKTKDDLLINKRSSSSSKKTSTDGSFKYTSDDVDSYTQFLQKGGTGPDGQAYNGRGKNDAYVDPGAYIAALGDWTDNGGTPAGFAKKFPVKENINPASYSKIPAAIRPTTKTTTKKPA